MPEEKKPFWVEAIPYNGALDEGDNVGYFNHRRIKVGQRFQVTEAQFSKKWMHKVSTKDAKMAAEEHDDTEAEEMRSGKRSGKRTSDSVI